MEGSTVKNEGPGIFAPGKFTDDFYIYAHNLGGEIFRRVPVFQS